MLQFYLRSKQIDDVAGSNYFQFYGILTSKTVFVCNFNKKNFLFYSKYLPFTQTIYFRIIVLLNFLNRLIYLILLV